MNEQLLCYLPGPMNASGILDRVCREQGVRLIPVSPAQGGQTLAALLGLAPLAADPPRAVPRAPVLVLCGFTRERMERFLDRLGQEKLPPVLKAMLTPTNLGWTLAALSEELVRERSELGG